ncbi:MAG: bifunctional [glutamate--ammonia ligase]-adenylyl-L-tyrosine phosphorylase/[glutamate--ammonia-ligase] adenylyltransferase, partial [Sphingomonadaceae bacterium]
MSAGHAGAAGEAIARARLHAPYLRALLASEEALAEQLAQGAYDEALAQSVARLDGPDPAAALRQAKAGVALTVAIADLAGAWPLERVTAELSRFADAAIDRALGAAFAERGIAEPDRRGMTVLGLGKLGSLELNYSSDVDLIVLHDPDLLPGALGDDPDEAAVRLVRRMGSLLADRTPDGYAWRVDLRLRPDPDSTPPSLRLAAAEAYYQSEALMWERSAFIRARAVAGDRAMGEAFLARLVPFVWRRSLDYSALAEIREVSLQIRDHFEEGQAFGPGYDVKRGRGGIREVEFFAQVHQMIFGGREPALRAPATLDALAALAAAGRIPAHDAATLSDAYRDLRTLEHRLQMVADQQTHRIPKGAADRARVAGLMGADGWQAVARAIEPKTRAVARLYDRLLEADRRAHRGSERIPLAEEEVLRWAKAARIADPAYLATALAQWRSGRPRSLRAPESRAAFETVAPALVKAVGRGKDGRKGLVRLDQFIAALPSGVQFWRLLVAHPPLGQLLARLMAETPLMADALAARPELFDCVIDPPPPLASVAQAEAELRAAVRGEGLEPLLDAARRWTAERRFRIAVDILEGRRDVLEASAELSDLAEAAIRVLQQAVVADFEAHYGIVPGGELFVLALGRFGGRALTAQSDLDLVLLFTGSHEATSEGGREAIGASRYFNRLAQRLVGALSAPTAAGPLYSVDTRLRPSGTQGLLAVSLESFARYQREEAELWETLALTRARPVSGSAGAQAEADRVLDGLLAQPREAEAVRRAAIAMRRLMEEHKKPASAYDVKLMKGGLVDLEFVVATRGLVAGRRLPG